MTAPTINGTRYPQPVDELLPAARKLEPRDGEKVPSRNRLMREFRIGAPKADALRDLLVREGVERDLAEAFGRGESAGAELVSVPVVPESVPVAESEPTAAPVEPAPEPSTEVTVPGHPGTPAGPATARRAAVWPVVLLALPAFVAVWSGWVGLGRMTGFGMVDLLPGIVEPGSWATIDSAITLPVGVETYAAYALYVWLSGRVPDRARRFARWSAIGSLIVGALGQVAYHLLVAAGVTSAPWQITTAVACLPVAVLGMGAALAHLVREDADRG